MIVGKSQWNLAIRTARYDKLWLGVLSSNEDVAMYTMAVIGFYMEFTKSLSYLVFYIFGYALNDRLEMLTSLVESEGEQAESAVKIISPSSKGLSTGGIRRLRGMLVKLLAIHRDFSSATQFMLLVQTMASTVITCFAVYYIFYNVSIFKLLRWKENPTNLYVSALFMVTTAELLILANCGEALSEKVRILFKMFD